MPFTPFDRYNSPGIGFPVKARKAPIVPADNTSAELQRAHDAAVEEGHHLDLMGATYTIKEGVKFRTASVNINANAAIFDARNMTGLFALQTDAVAGDSMFGAKTHSIYNLEIIGPTGQPSSSGLTGLLVKGTAASRSPRPTFFGLHIEGFGIGIDFSDYAYLSQFYGFESRSAAIAVRQSVGLDSGENVGFIGGALYNSTEVCVQTLDESSEMNFTATSFDYSPKIIQHNAGRINLFGCHLENRGVGGWANDAIYLTGDGTTLNSYGGFLLSATEQATGLTQLINVADTRAAAFFDGMMPQNFGNTLNKLATGNVFFRNTRIYANGINVNPTRITDSFSQLIDGSFEASTFPRDYWSLLVDSAGTATSRITGANGTLGLSSVVAKVGTKSLLANKTGIGAFTFVLLVRLNGSTGPISGQFHHTAVAGTPLTGAATNWDAGFTILNGNDSNGIPTIPVFNSVASNSFTPTVGTWTNVNIRVPGYVPTWATHFYVRFTLPAGSTGGLHLDDASVTQW